MTLSSTGSIVSNLGDNRAGGDGANAQFTTSAAVVCAGCHTSAPAVTSHQPPIWMPCQDCENYWCVRHQKHVHACECPPIEEWPESPYG